VNNEIVENELFDDSIWSEVDLLRGLKKKAREQLGTVGSGNHYVDLFTDEQTRIWVGVHFGSRGLGHSIATYFVKQGGGVDGVHAEPVVFSDNSDLGEQYLKCMEIAGRYAYAGRDWVCERVAKILRANIIDSVHNHHNYAWRETHFGKDLWVVRKGATPAFPGQKGFVGGSMGDLSYIIEGSRRGTQKGEQATLSDFALYSTIHGAGRAMGRTQAKGKRDKRGNVVRAGLISKDAMQSWIKDYGVELRGADVDEAPQAYKRIEEVISAHKGTIDILHTLRPIGVCMADSRTKDPYKD
jgi:tRNA-splicing ligase RtcB (3'-phosphate/5'-hydroxy nucleic acid ligase)